MAVERSKGDYKADEKVTGALDADRPDADFAAVWEDGARKKQRALPIYDAAHVRNALARFNQVQGMPAEVKMRALAKIKAAAKKYTIGAYGND